VRAQRDQVGKGAQLADESDGQGAPAAGEALWLATAIGVAVADAAFLAAARNSIREGDLDAVLGEHGTAIELAERAGISDALIGAAHAIDFPRFTST